MKRVVLSIGGILAAAVLATSAQSDGHADKAVAAAVKARKAQMTLYSHHLGLLGGMAKGDVAYDADAATAAARSLAALSQLDQSRLWPKGSDNATLGPEATRSLPAIWEAGSEAGDMGMALATAAATLEQAAGGGLDALRGAMGAVGKSCGGCHKAYRQEK